MTTNVHYLTGTASSTMLNGIVWGTALAAFAYLGLRLSRRHTSSTRFAVWYSVLLLIVLLPFFDSMIARSTSSASGAEITIPATWAFYFFAGWALLAAIGLVRVAAGLWQIRRLRRTAMPLHDPGLAALLQKTALAFSTNRSVEIRASQDIGVPTAIGFIRPMVLIPLWAIKELSNSDMNALVLHELAHLRRWDDWSNLLQKILGAILIFHPAVWWIDSRLALEREMACDDLVLAGNSDPRAYAECLVTLAERSFLRRGLAMAQAAVGHFRQTSLRVAQILNSRRSVGTTVWKPSLAIVMAGALATFAGAQHLPRLVGFSSHRSEVTEGSPARADGGNVPAGTSLIGASAHRDLLAITRKSSGVAKAWRPDHRQAALPARAKATRASTKPLVVRAEFKPSQDVKPPDVFLVVMRSEQNSMSGATFWSVSVYRLTVFHPTQQQIRNETPAKKT